jgi:hypothetical protein
VYNKRIDFLFITDNELPFISKNIKYLKISFDEINKLIKKNLGSDCVCNVPYKLCDYRPAYGILFSEFVSGYDYWGHCDCDVIWGDLWKYLKKPILKGYDKVFNYGHLTLYKNSELIKNAFKFYCSKINWKYVFHHRTNFMFDEWGGIGLLFKENGLSIFEEDNMLDVCVPQYTGILKIKFNNQKNYKQQAVIWEDGNIFLYYLKNKELIKEEYCYIHLQKRKFMKNNIISNRFLMLPSGFTDIETINESIFDRYDFNGKGIVVKRRSLFIDNLPRQLHVLKTHIFTPFQRTKNV